MDTDGIDAWRKFGVLVAICLVFALGESRRSGPEAVASMPASVQATNATSVAFESDRAAQLGADEDGPSTAADSGEAKDDAHLVPAIYAWDPDVRFVYFRPVSKWM